MSDLSTLRATWTEKARWPHVTVTEEESVAVLKLLDAVEAGADLSAAMHRLVPKPGETMRQEDVLPAAFIGLSALDRFDDTMKTLNG